jgi:hypothetical protein
MLEQIHLTITCTDCCKGVMFCSGNDNRRIVCEGNRLKAESNKILRLARKISGRNHKTREENEHARYQFNMYLMQNYDLQAHEICDQWLDKRDQALTQGEMLRLIERAEQFQSSSQPQAIRKPTLIFPRHSTSAETITSI